MNENSKELIRSKCLSCGLDIPRLAILCSNCGAYQSSWRNELKYWSGIVGLIILVFSGASFTADFSKRFYDSLVQPDLAISELNVFSETAVWNTSKSDLLITHVRIRSSEPSVDLQWPVYRTIKPSTVERFQLLCNSDRNWHESKSKRGHSYTHRPGEYANTLDQQTISSIKNSMEESKLNYVVSYVLKNGPEHRQLNDWFNMDLYELPCKGDILYMDSVAGKERSFPFACVGLIRHRLESVEKPNCKENVNLNEQNFGHNK